MSGVQEAKLGSLVKRAGTWNPRRSGNGASFEYIDLSSIDQDGKVIGAVHHIRSTEAPSRARQLVAAGDVLVSTVRPNLNAVAIVPDELDGATASTGFCVLRVRPDSLDSRFLFHWVRSPQFVDTLVRGATGASYPAVTDGFILSTTLPLPPLPEQRRIADVLDRADALRSARRSCIVLLSQLVLAAFGAHFAPAELAERVPLARAFAIPPNYGTMIPPAETGGFLSLRVKNIQNASLDLSDTKYVDLPPKDRRRHSVEDDDLLMARAIGSLEHLGKCVVVYPGDAQWAFDSHLMRIRLDRTVMLPEYLRVWLLTPGGRAAFLRIARRSAVQHNVNTKEIAAFPVPIPSLAKQRAFVECLQAIEAEERLMASSLAYLDGLFGSLRYRAFAGEL